MIIKDAQKLVDDWINKYGVRYFNELTNMAILTEEVGEVARLMSRIYGEQSFKNQTTEKEAKQMLADELADVLFVLFCIANQTNIDINKAFENNIQKKTLRDNSRHLSNDKIRN
jgi:NTP pyrophosphatase (non-canonical NTP hydrolase)